MLDELDKLVENYKKMLRLRLAILFGSRARGDYTDKSDIDILVVADNLPKDPRESFAVLRDIDFVKIHPIGFNTEIFLKKLKEGSTFIIEIIEEGKPLYADKEFLEQVMNIYKEIRSKYTRRGKAWILTSSQP